MKTNGIQALRGLVGVLGRVMLCTIFLTAAFGYTDPAVDGVAELAGTKAGLTPPWAFLGGVAVLLLGSLSVAVGYKARFGALLLLAFLGLTTYYFHGFTLWTVMSAQARQEQIAQLVTNLSLSGAMLFIIANGPGQMSLDAKRR